MNPWTATRRWVHRQVARFSYGVNKACVERAFETQPTARMEARGNQWVTFDVYTDPVSGKEYKKRLSETPR